MLDILIEHDVPATMRDGIVLRADVYRPSSDGPWPVLVTRLPYGKSVAVSLAWLDPLALAGNGYIVVVQDTRGRFSSGGEWEPWTFEEQDGYDTVQWAATLPDSNGSVGMFGDSYFGNTQWMAALSRPPALKAIAPAITWSDPDDGLFARGGVCELGITVPWSLLQGLDTMLRRHADDPIARQDALLALVSDIDAVATSGYWEGPAESHPAFARHGLAELGFERSRRDPAWSAACRVSGRHNEVEVPSLNVGGWYDIFCQGTLENFGAMRAAGRPAKLIVGPWSHVGRTSQLGDVNFGLAASGDVVGFRGRLVDLEANWFRHWLTPQVAAEQATAEDGLPPVLLFVMGINQWREEQEWPLSRAVDTALFLRDGGALSFDPPYDDEDTDAYDYDPADPVRTTGGAILMSPEYRPGPLDQAKVERRPDVLVYTSEPLHEDLEVTGRIRAVVHAVSEAPTADWVVRLCDVDGHGASVNVVDGIVRTEAPTGEFAEHSIDLWSTSHVFRAGHRLRVHVTSSNFPRWERNAHRARQTIAHDATHPSRLMLPVVPASTIGE